MATGAFPPPQSALRAAQGQTGSGETEKDLLKSCSKALWLLVNRLAPQSFRQRFSLSALPIGNTSTPATINAPSNVFNALIVNLTTGIVNIYIGNIFFYQVQAGINPTEIYLPPTPVNGNISFQTDPSSPAAATGTIDVIQL